MRLKVLLILLGLRYRLLWAQMRLRRGKIALFVTGYLLACFLAATLMLGGFGAAAAAVRLGRAETVARIVLAGFSGIAIVAALAFGAGVNPAFSEAVLRRYPLSAADRFATRRLTAFLDPLWIILLALFLGVAAGFHAAGIGSTWLAAPAVLLLVMAAFLFVQLVAEAIGRLAATSTGLAFLAGLIAVPMVALSAVQATAAAGHLWAALLPVIRITPAFLAAAAMTGGPAPGLLLQLAWCAAMAGALAGIERLPRRSQTAPGVPAEWDAPCDRFAALFGASAPLVAKTLRCYWRTKRARFSLLMNLPAPLLLLGISADRSAPLLHFFIGAGLMTVIGFLATFVVAVNSFGFDGSGFRRYFFLPLPPAAIVRAASLVPLVLGAMTLPLAFTAGVLLARVPVDFRMAVMLAANGLGGLCFFHALALWTSILAPSRADGEMLFGNDYSLAANVVGTGGMLGVIFGSQFLGLAAGPRFLQFWWIAPGFMTAGVGFYVVTFRMAPKMLLSRRERILAVVEREPQSGRVLA